jgi:hypothetical protein
VQSVGGVESYCSLILKQMVHIPIVVLRRVNTKFEPLGIRIGVHIHSLLHSILHKLLHTEAQCCDGENTCDIQNVEMNTNYE